jgi:hypothetical protein
VPSRGSIASEMPVNISLLPALEDFPGANHNAAPFHSSIGECCSGEISKFPVKCDLNAQQIPALHSDSLRFTEQLFRRMLRPTLDPTLATDGGRDKPESPPT